jgi:hypothetical protein
VLRKTAQEKPASGAGCGDLIVDDLEQTIATLIERKYAATEGSAEYRMVMRQLYGLRHTREEAGPIMEDLDPMGWGAMTDRHYSAPPRR